MNYSIKLEGDHVVFSLSGRITASDAETLRKVTAEAVIKWHDKQWVLECGDLSYISSSGLRWLLSLKKQISKRIRLTDVGQTVMDIFSLTGFDKLFSIQKKLRKIILKGCARLGVGANGEVYRLKDETIVKAFYPGVDLESVEREGEISHIVLETGLPVVITYDTVQIEDGRYGIVYEILGSKTLSETIEENTAKFNEWISQYVKLYRQVHETDGMHTRLPLAKDVYRRHLTESADWYSKEELEQLLKLLESIPDRNTLIHGDYHPNNIMVSSGELIMIDLGDFSIGHPVFDFLATAATQANLVELSPDYAEIHTKMKAERIRKGWNALLEQYFPDRTPEERSRIDAQVRLLSRLKVACAPAVAKGITEELMRESVNDVKKNLIPYIEKLLGTIDW